VKKLFSFILLSCCLAVFAHAQSVGSLNIFSESGDKFYLFLDGKKQNDVAQANIRVQELPDLYYSAKIIFKDSSIAPVSKSNLYVSDGDDIMRDASYRIRREKGSKSKLVFFSMVPVKPNYIPPAGMYVYHFGQPSSEMVPVVEKKAAATEMSHGGSLTVFSQSGEKFYLFLDGKKQNEIAQSNIRIQELPELYYQARIVFKNPGIAPIIKNNLYVSDGDDVLMDASYRIRRDKAGKVKLNFYSMKPAQQNFVPPAGMYVYHYGSQAPDSISGISKSLPSAKNSGTTATPNTTVGKTINLKSTAVKTADPKTGLPKKTAVENVSKVNTNAKKANSIDSVAAKGAAKSIAVDDNKTANQNKGVTVNKKCNGWPMGKADLAAAKKTIENAGKDESRFAVAKEIISSNCLMASQVTELCSLFKSEKLRLEFAKYAYSFTTDRKNYGEVSKAIASDPGRKELTKFISNNL
jgi:hypothetical protein